ncbi:MAG: 2'-5' RNA ligase family protein [Ferruginibacter sp.]
MTNNNRRQLTLFVEQKDAKLIEQVRHEFNPVQFELIRSHVTLCRDEEIQNLELVISNIVLMSQTEILITFAKVARFDNKKGLLLPATTNNAEFQKLRQQVLVGLINNSGMQVPHITLMHPRNSTCTDKIFEKIEKLAFPTILKFKTISLIEQENGGKWRVLQEFDLKQITY